jgi:hypothetical protein
MDDEKRDDSMNFNEIFKWNRSSRRRRGPNPRPEKRPEPELTGGFFTDQFAGSRKPSKQAMREQSSHTRYYIEEPDPARGGLLDNIRKLKIKDPEANAFEIIAKLKKIGFDASPGAVAMVFDDLRRERWEREKQKSTKAVAPIKRLRFPD